MTLARLQDTTAPSGVIDGVLEGGLAGGFTIWDWLVVLGVLALTTVIGERMAGKQETERDFFLGGRRLPWYAVAASIIATEISAVTYVSLPWVVAQPGGNVTYLQIGLIGGLIAKMLVGYVLVPAYFQREIFSPYDYMGERLGEPVRRMTTVLFALGGILGQAARVYLTAVVVEVLLHEPLTALEASTGIPPLVAAVGAIGVVAILWTLIGGIATVVWTDAILFLLFIAGIAVSLTILSGGIDGGLTEALRSAFDAGKLQLIDFDTDPTKAYTFWVALFAASWGQVGPYGTDQLIAQRLFCCKDARDARRAIIASYAAMGLTILVAVVGVGLWAYFDSNPMSPGAAAMVAEKGDRLFPVFIREVLPAGLKGLVVAGAFAAAISSLDSILAALSQTTLSAFWVPWRRRSGRELLDPEAEGRARVRLSRVLVLFWGVLLCAVAVGMDRLHEVYGSILDLALAMAGFTGGALLAGFMLAFLPWNRGGKGFVWSAPLSVLTVLFAVWHDDVAYKLSWWAVGIVLGLWLLFGLPRRKRPGGAAQTLVLAFYLFLLTRLADVGDFDNGKSIAWPWYVPLGSVIAFVFALILDGPRDRGERED